MKSLIVVGCLIFSALGVTLSAPSDAGKSEADAQAKPTVLFQSYNGDPAKPAEMDFQIRYNNQSHFLKVGEIIPRTTLRITGFALKTRKRPQSTDGDASELTLTDSATKEIMVLSIGQKLESKK